MTEEYEGSRTEFMKLLADHDSPPAYIVRAQRVESVWENLLAVCRERIREFQEMPQTRLAMLAHLIDHRWANLTPHQDQSTIEYLKQLHADWQPQLRAEVIPTTSLGKIQRAMQDLKRSFERCNRRWEKFVREVDLDEVNYERSQYNDYYLVEKSAALGSDKLAEMGFERLPMAQHEDILDEIPLLRVPSR